MTFSTTIRPTPPAIPEMRWRANVDNGERHAFPLVDGARGMKSLCDLRWTAAFGKHGTSECSDCAGILRQLIAGRVTLEGLA